MPQFEFEVDLEIGEVLIIDEYHLTVLEIEDEEVTLRLDQPDVEDETLIHISRAVLPR